METINHLHESFLKKIAKSDGIISSIVCKQSIPRIYRIRQKFDDVSLDDIEAEIINGLGRPDTLDKIQPGQSICIAVGSRGITGIAKITKTIVEMVKKAGGKPFIIPAMGSHGGATAEGQKEVLKEYGITEKNMECPIKASMETVPIGTSGFGMPVFIDKYAYEADGIILINRIKPHTAFRGVYESGLIKMATIGLGKQKGAEICHAQGFQYMERNIMSITKVVLEKCKIFFGVAVVENAYDKTKIIRMIPSGLLFEEETALLEEAKRNMPSILIKEFDVLIVDEIGKNISGDGMDPNITGTFATPFASGGAKKQRTVVLNLTDETHGNALGLGLADFSVQRAFDKFDFEKTFPNVITCTVTAVGKIPMIMACDRLAIQAAIQTCTCIDYNNPRIVRIKNTLKLDEIYISENLAEEASMNPRIEILEGPEEMCFDEKGNLF